MKYLVIVCLLIYCFDLRSQPVQTVRLADSLLKRGNFKVGVIKYDFPPNIKRIQEICLKNLLANPEWADKYLVTMIKKGDVDINYMSEYGISKKEFDTLLQGFRSRKKAFIQDTLNLTILRDNGLIIFKTAGRLLPFNYLTIDTKKISIIYDNYYINREVKLEGKFYAPILMGYEAFAYDSPFIKGKTKKANVSAGGFSIGHHIGDDKTTMVLLVNKSLSEHEEIVITILH